MLAKEVRPKKDTDRSQQRPLKLKKKEEKKKNPPWDQTSKEGFSLHGVNPHPKRSADPITGPALKLPRPGWVRGTQEGGVYERVHGGVNSSERH